MKRRRTIGGAVTVQMCAGLPFEDVKKAAKTNPDLYPDECMYQACFVEHINDATSSFVREEVFANRRHLVKHIASTNLPCWLPKPQEMPFENLEHLEFRLTGAHPISFYIDWLAKSPKLETVVWNDERMTMHWDEIYAFITQLPMIKSLTINCYEIRSFLQTPKNSNDLKSIRLQKLVLNTPPTTLPFPLRFSSITELHIGRQKERNPFLAFDELVHCFPSLTQLYITNLNIEGNQEVNAMVSNLSSLPLETLSIRFSQRIRRYLMSIPSFHELTHLKQLSLTCHVHNPLALEDIPHHVSSLTLENVMVHQKSYNIAVASVDFKNVRLYTSHMESNRQAQTIHLIFSGDCTQVRLNDCKEFSRLEFAHVNGGYKEITLANCEVFSLAFLTGHVAELSLQNSTVAKLILNRQNAFQKLMLSKTFMTLTTQLIEICESFTYEGRPTQLMSADWDVNGELTSLCSFDLEVKLNSDRLKHLSIANIDMRSLELDCPNLETLEAGQGMNTKRVQVVGAHSLRSIGIHGSVDQLRFTRCETLLLRTNAVKVHGAAHHLIVDQPRMAEFRQNWNIFGDPQSIRQLTIRNISSPANEHAWNPFALFDLPNVEVARLENISNIVSLQPYHSNIRDLLINQCSCTECIVPDYLDSFVAIGCPHLAKVSVSKFCTRMKFVNCPKMSPAVGRSNTISELIFM